jgi:hypothetical protein
MTELRSGDAPFLRKRAQQQRLQSGDHDAADADKQNDAELHRRGTFADPCGGWVQAAPRMR